MARSPVKMMGAALAAATAIEAVRRRRSGADPAHAPGHRHLGPPPTEADPVGAHGSHADRNQPWVRRSHSDSQQRRFRR
jgi:hypothetical protein